MPNIMAFKTLDKSVFLVFGVSNAKYLAFDTRDGNALRRACLGSERSRKAQIFYKKYCYLRRNFFDNCKKSSEKLAFLTASLFRRQLLVKY